MEKKNGAKPPYQKLFCQYLVFRVWWQCTRSASSLSFKSLGRKSKPIVKSFFDMIEKSLAQENSLARRDRNEIPHSRIPERKPIVGKVRWYGKLTKRTRKFKANPLELFLEMKNWKSPQKENPFRGSFASKRKWIPKENTLRGRFAVWKSTPAVVTSPMREVNKTHIEKGTIF